MSVQLDVLPQLLQMAICPQALHKLLEGGRLLHFHHSRRIHHAFGQHPSEQDSFRFHCAELCCAFLDDLLADDLGDVRRRCAGLHPDLRNLYSLMRIQIFEGTSPCLLPLRALEILELFLLPLV